MRRILRKIAAGDMAVWAIPRLSRRSFGIGGSCSKKRAHRDAVITINAGWRRECVYPAYDMPLSKPGGKNLPKGFCRVTGGGKRAHPQRHSSLCGWGAQRMR